MGTGHSMSREKLITALVLLGLGIVMTLTNRWITFMDDEVAILQEATNPIQQTVHAFTNGMGQHRHPPLYDLLLAGWLRVSGGRVALLRVPATLFYLLGLWFVVQAAGLLGGSAASRAALWIGVVFPYGFHFGRIAGWYSLSFCTVALMTYAYLRIQEKQSWGRWVILVVACELAVYTNYFLLALIGLLLVDYWLMNRGKSMAHLAAAGGTLVVILLGFYPLIGAFLVRLNASAGLMRPAYSLLATVFFGGYNVYTLFVSESVAPWFWYFSVPALAAICLCAYFVLRFGPGPARRIFIGFLACMLVMTALNLINTKVALFLAPWLLIPVAAMVGNLPGPGLRKGAVLALALIGAIGWFGILSRHYYAAPRLIEPWQPVAEQAAGEVKQGAIVIGSNSSFFFYLTDAIRSSGDGGSHRFIGSYPERMRHRQLFTPNQWLEAGKVYGQTTLLVKGATDEFYWAAEAATEKVLDQNCHLDGVERELPDTGFALKRRWFAGAQQPAWRIEVRTYRCPAGSNASAELRMGMAR
jgi:Dolichyl-phosphate-mannose-protein mannosyltransferase